MSPAPAAVPHALSCPHDGSQLREVVGAPGSPPYLCDDCRRAWWPAELTEQARQRWNAVTRSFPATAAGAAIRSSATGQAVAARARGRDQ